MIGYIKNALFTKSHARNSCWTCSWVDQLRLIAIKWRCYMKIMNIIQHSRRPRYSKYINAENHFYQFYLLTGFDVGVSTEVKWKGKKKKTTEPYFPVRFVKS